MTVQRIVLIDDNEADNVYHELVLRRAGFKGELQVFEMAELALAHLQQHCPSPQDPPCLVLLDINMPGMDGWEFARAAAPLLQHTPTLMLVMLTSSSAPEDLARARSMPELHGIVTKPLDVAIARQLLSGDTPASARFRPADPARRAPGGAGPENSAPAAGHWCRA